MIFFNNHNYFEIPTEVHPKIFYPKAVKQDLLNFCFKVDRRIGGNSVQSFKLVRRDGKTFNLTNSLIAVFWDDTPSTEKFYYTFLNQFVALLLLTAECDIYQFQIVLGTSIPITYYSNWFTVDTDINNYLILGSSGFFDEKMYDKGFVHKLYFNKRSLTSNPYLEETIIETADTTRLRENQIYSEIYTLKIYCDRYMLKELNKVPLMDSCYIEFEDMELIPIKDRIEVQSSYNEEHKLYEVDLTFKTNQIIKNCELTSPAALVSGTINYAIVNDSGDRLTTNGTDVLIYNTLDY